MLQTVTGRPGLWGAFHCSHPERLVGFGGEWARPGYIGYGMSTSTRGRKRGPRSKVGEIKRNSK
jgi:hypothetical protein